MALLANVWSLSPDVRLGQLFAHVGFLGEAYFGRGLGDLEDDEILSTLCRHQNELLARLPGSTSDGRAPEAAGITSP